MMNYEERKEWLASLKEGDTVCVYRRGWGTCSYYELFTIKRTTATQLVALKRLGSGFISEVKFRKENGRIIGSDDYDKIEPVTDEVRLTNRRSNLITWASNIKPKNITTECLEALKAAYDSFDNPYMEDK